MPPTAETTPATHTPATPTPDPASTPPSSSSSAPAAAMPPAPDPIDIPTGPMPMVERGMYTGSMPLAESGVPAEPVIPREPFIPPELMARRRPPAPHSAAYGIPMLQAPPLRPGQGAPPPSAAIPVASPSGPIDPAGPGHGARRRNLLLGLGALVVVIAVAVGLVVTLGNQPDNTKVATPKVTATAPPAKLSKTITSLDPVPGGSGFKNKNGVWDTEGYNTAKFGNLKKGVGLVLDLGSAQNVSSVSFDAGTGPITVDLRTADQASAPATGYTKVAAAKSGASGPTTLDGSAGGSHQYWLIWVSSLGPDGNGKFDAQLHDIVVTAKK